MANISFFYPDRMKGFALGLNAAGGNIGVSSVQLLTPILMGVRLDQSLSGDAGRGRRLSPERRTDVARCRSPIAVIGAFFFMDNLDRRRRSSFKDQLAIVKRKHTWIMSFLYIGTFGSFIGYSAAFPLLIKTQFPAVTIAHRLPRAAGRLAVASARRPARRQDRRRDRDVLELHRDGRGDDRRHVLRRASRTSPASSRCS